MALSSTPVPGIIIHFNIHGKKVFFNAESVANAGKYLGFLTKNVKKKKEK